MDGTGGTEGTQTRKGLWLQGGWGEEGRLAVPELPG